MNYMIELYHIITLPNYVSYPTQEEINKKEYEETTAASHYFVTPGGGIEGEKFNMLNNQKINDSISNKSMEINDLEPFMITDDIVDNNYKDFNISKMKKIITLKNTKSVCDKVYVLKDGTIIISQIKGYSYLYFLSGKMKDECFNLNLGYISNLFEMDDGMVIVLINYKLMLLNIKDVNFGKIEFISRVIPIITRLSNNKFLMIEFSTQGSIYNYNNKGLLFVKKIILNSLKKIISPPYVLALNEKEIAIIYTEEAFTMNSYKYYLGFFDIEKDKKIKSFELKKGKFALCKFNEKLLIVGNESSIFQIDLLKHSKKREFKLKGNSNIHSIVALNEKQIIVAQNDYTYQFELDKDYNLKLLYTINFGSYSLYKYPKNRLLLIQYEPYPRTMLLFG